MKGALLYRQEALNQETLERYGKNTPDDWLEQHVYAKYPTFGILLMLTLDVVLFGWAGLLVWLVQMLWIPFWAAGVINGLGHFWGYRNWNTPDASTNLSPVGILIGGKGCIITIMPLPCQRVFPTVGTNLILAGFTSVAWNCWDWPKCSRSLHA
ncbi:MAG: hypothetical protein R3E89_01485 [Thiolinea sp.]